MSANANPASSITCAENIVLLSILNEVPNSSQSNPLPVVESDPELRRVLSLERESHLAGTIAFLSGISHDASHIVATCVEEVPRGAGMRVVLAINKEHAASGNSVLQKIKLGLQNVFRVLSEATRGAYSVIMRHGSSLRM